MAEGSGDDGGAITDGKPKGAPAIQAGTGGVLPMGDDQEDRNRGGGQPKSGRIMIPRAHQGGRRQ